MNLNAAIRSIDQLRCVKQFLALILLCSWIGGGFCLCLTTPIVAQDAQPPAEGSRNQKEGAQQPAAAPPPGAKFEEKKDDKNEEQSRGAFVVAPLPIVSPAIGSGIVPVVGYIFPFQAKDKSSPPSVVGAAGLITNNGSRGFGLGGDLYLKEARYELKSIYVRGSVDYNLYGVGYANESTGLKLPLEQTGQMFFIEFLRGIGWKFFLGGRFITGTSFITVKPTSGETLSIPPDAGLTTNLRALGVTLVRDSRPNRFYPVRGSVIDFTVDFFANVLGSKYSFQSYNFTFNKYFSLSEKQVLAYNLFLCATGGEPPFYGNCIYGTTVFCSARSTTSICGQILRGARQLYLEHGCWRSLLTFAEHNSARYEDHSRCPQGTPSDGKKDQVDLEEGTYAKCYTDFSMDTSASHWV